MESLDYIEFVFEDLRKTLGNEFINATIEAKKAMMREEFESALQQWLDS